MGVIFLVAGILLVACGLNNTLQGEDGLFDLVKKDFTGPNNFGLWLLAIFSVGAIGYAKNLKPFANAFLFLIGVILILSHSGFFTKFTAAFGATGNGQGSPSAGSYQVTLDDILKLFQSPYSSDGVVYSI